MYIPNLKTSDSEIRAIRFLSTSVKGMILPAFELTRSRKTSKLPNGSIDVRMDQLIDAYGGDNFILDVSVEEDLINDEIYSFFDQKGGYANWRHFIKAHKKKSLIPCVLYEEDGTKHDFQTQVSALLEEAPRIALRLSANDENAGKLYNWCLEVAGPDKIVVIGNLYFIGINETPKYIGYASTFIDNVIGNKPPSILALPLSSFPRSVVDNGYGDDREGKFEASEYQFYNALRARYSSAPLVFSDFASVHPIRYPTRGGAWVPRIDVPVDSEFVYRRVRRNEGGYVQAASELKRVLHNDFIDCWASEQIRLAAAGTPGGISPSYWISARINYWITKLAYENAR